MRCFSLAVWAWLFTRPWSSSSGAVAAGDDSSPPRRLRDAYGTFPYEAWSGPLKAGTCCAGGAPLAIELRPRTAEGAGASITCALEGGVKTYRFPAGIFEIDEQLLIPESTAIIGAKNPNDMSQPTKSPDWRQQTLFLATRGATDYKMDYCHAQDMMKTRVGFVLSSHVTVRDVSYQGIDTIRPEDNGALCGGGAFETKGCAENDCEASDVNNGGSDGIGSVNVTIERVRLNDYHYAEDSHLVGASVPGNYNCGTLKFKDECCFCKPNGVRSSQVGVWVPMSRNVEGSRHILVRNVVSSSTQADGVNLHGSVDDALVQTAYFQNTGDDIYAVWGAVMNPTNVVFRDSVAINPGVLRPNWYGNCVATYGLKSVVFANLTCRAPTLERPIPSPGDPKPRGSINIDTSMFFFHSSFSAGYPEGNSVKINGWTFEDLEGSSYRAGGGSMNEPAPGKMAWTRSDNGVVAPHQIDAATETSQHINIVVWGCADSCRLGYQGTSPSTPIGGLTNKNGVAHSIVQRGSDLISFVPVELAAGVLVVSALAAVARRSPWSLRPSPCETQGLIAAV